VLDAGRLRRARERGVKRFDTSGADVGLFIHGRALVELRHSMSTTALIVGGTSGIGHEVARQLAARGEDVGITGRDETRAKDIAASLGRNVRGFALDLARPDDIASHVESVASVDHLVIAAIDRDDNKVRTYDTRRALNLVTMKLVGYSEVIHT